MILYTGSASGQVHYFQPLGIDLRELTEGTDYAGYTGASHDTGATVEIYDQGGSNELTCVSFDMMTPDGLSAVGNIAAASDLVPPMEIIEDVQDSFVQSVPFDSVSGSQPADFELHRRDWYYKTYTPETSGGLTQTLGWNQTAASEVWSSPPYYKNTEYCNLFWTASGGCFGAGTYLQKSGSTYYIIACAGARCSKPASGYVCYPNHTGEWEPRYHGIADLSMFAHFSNNNRRNEASYYQLLTNYAAQVSRIRIVLCSFVYQDAEYFGCAVLAFGIDDSLLHCGCWGISKKWWNTPGSKYNYTVEPDGTSKKAVNPGYTKSGGRWTQSSLPTANALVMGTNYLSVSADGTPYGCAVYSLTQDDFNSAIQQWANKLSGFLGSMGDWYDRVKNSVSYTVSGFQTMISNPIESILKVHTIPVPAALIPTYTATSVRLATVRSGGCPTDLDTKNRLVRDLDRIVTIECQSPQITRKTGWFSDWTNTSISLYVPLVGEIPLKPEDVLNHTLYVRYRIDIMTGDFIVIAANEYSNINVSAGNCSIPVVCASSATLQERALHSISGAIQSGVQIAAAASIGNTPGLISGAAGAANSLTQSLQQHVTYSQIGGDGALFNGVYTPCLIVRRPNPVTGDLGSYDGYVSGHVGQIRDAQIEGETSYIRVQTADLDGINATDAEKQEIMRLLKGGVYL